MVTHQVSATDIISLLSAHDTTTTQGILEMPRAREQCLFLAEVLPKCSLHEGNVFFFLAHGQRAIPFPSKDAAEMLTAFEQRLFFFFFQQRCFRNRTLARSAGSRREGLAVPANPGFLLQQFGLWLSDESTSRCISLASFFFLFTY